MLNTPIIFLIFKRFEETSRVFNEIKIAKPKKIFVIADGPRNEEEKELTDKTRKIIDNIDWECEVYKNYSEKNMGCRERVISGINWAFEKTYEAIILEDDCLPDQSFFKFCEEMLNKYRDNLNIMHIGGSNFQQENQYFIDSIGKDSYYFSNIAQIWGWATWKRAWNKYDGYMNSWGKIKNNKKFINHFPNKYTYQYWKHFFDRMARNEFNTWDIAWTYTCFKENGLCIMPRVNLIENIGSNASTATHKSNNLTHIKRSYLSLPIIHPKNIEINKLADKFTYKKVYGVQNNLIRTIKSYIKQYLPSLFQKIKLLMK